MNARIGIVGGAVLVLAACMAGPSATSSTSGAAPSPSSSSPAIATSAPPSMVASWAATGSLAVARAGHTATLLLDGRVLVVGGDKGTSTTSSGLASAEIYVPSTRTWTATAPMSGPRTGHSATLLLDGRVLVAGGNPYEALPGCDTPSCSQELATAELYDPKTGHWTATGHMATGRAGHSATPLADGRVLVAGGVGGGTSLRTAEIYNPATGAWTKTGSMAGPRAGHAAAGLRDGSVLIVGGFGETGVLGTAERFDPHLGTWAAAGNLPTGTLGSATVLGDGNVLIAGGDTSLATPSSAVLFDPSTGMWSATGSMITARQGHVTALLADGTVLACGGWNATEGDAFLATAEIYFPAESKWVATASPREAIANATATALSDGTVLVVGGDTNGGAGTSTPTASAELYILAVTAVPLG
jgi:N-acetylneuraminic acid mutarotase